MCGGLAKPTKVDNKWTITLSDRNHRFILSFSVFVLDRKLILSNYGVVENADIYDMRYLHHIMEL